MKRDLKHSTEGDVRVSCLAPNELDRWDAFVADHPWASACHRTTWMRAIEQAFPQVQGHVLTLKEAERDTIIAGLPLYSVRSWLLGNRLVSVPFAAWCDPLVNSPAQLRLLLREAKRSEAKVRARFIEVRVRHSAWMAREVGLVERGRWKHHSVRLDRPLEALWSKLSRTAVRRLVRAAERNGVVVREEVNQEAVRAFHQMLSNARQQLGLPRIPLGYFEALRNCLGTKGHLLLLARKGDSVCGGVVATKCQNTFHLEYSAPAGDAVPNGTMQLLYWEALKRARAEGHAEFSLGRTSVHHDGLLAYKRHWGGVEEEVLAFCNQGRPARTSVEKGNPVRLVNVFIRLLPRPLYDRVGDFIYRHK